MFKNKELRDKMETSKIKADAALLMMEQLNSEADPEKRKAAMFYIRKCLKDISKNLKDS